MVGAVAIEEECVDGVFTAVEECVVCIFSRVVEPCVVGVFTVEEKWVVEGEAVDGCLHNPHFFGHFFLTKLLLHLQ